MKSRRCICAVAFAAAMAYAQPADPALTFEVASVKPNQTLSTSTSINWAGGGTLNCTNVTLRGLIEFAYNVQDYQLLNAPSWVGAEHFDIMAKPDPEAAKAEPIGNKYSEAAATRMRMRTRALLAERFGLALHTETKEGSIFALVQAKGGAKLKPTETENGPQISWNDKSVKCKKVTMLRFAEVVLANRMGRKVMDKTGLNGEFDFEMSFVPDPAPPKEGAPINDLIGPTFSVALQEQLGLRIESAKGPEDYLVIEKIDRPTAN